MVKAMSEHDIDAPVDNEVVRFPPPRPFKRFQVRWREPLGVPGKPYMIRYVLNLWLFSIRVHIWYGPDDTRYMHDHAFDFVTLVIKGMYYDVTQDGADLIRRGDFKFRKAEHKHFVNPSLALLLCLYAGLRVASGAFGSMVD